MKPLIITGGEQRLKITVNNNYVHKWGRHFKCYICRATPTGTVSDWTGLNEYGKGAWHKKGAGEETGSRCRAVGGADKGGDDKGGGVQVIRGADKAEETGMGRGLVIGVTGKWGETGSTRKSDLPMEGTDGGGDWHGEGTGKGQETGSVRGLPVGGTEFVLMGWGGD